MKVAVVGGGISGLSAAVILSPHHEVHLFESEPRLGGHAHTVTVQEETGQQVPVDTGFLVFNDLTYPHLIAFFKLLGVETVASSMSLAIRVHDKNIEWSGTNLKTIFAQKRNLFRPSFLKMLFEILRFHRDAEKNLILCKRHAWSLGDLLAQRQYSEEFRHHYLLPIGAAIWSTPEKSMLEFPAATFLTFFINHKLLQVNDRPVWRTVKNGSINYVEKARKLITHVHTDAKITSVERTDKGIVVKTDKASDLFDRVVMATHAPTTSKLLKNQTDQEKRVLGAFHVESNQTLLHCDESLMPVNRSCWAAWNVFASPPQQSQRRVSLSYYLNELQPLPTKKNYFVTLNPAGRVPISIKEFSYDHPQFDQNSIRAQRELPEIQGNGGVYFAGAWTRYGFHEDGILSAVNAAAAMGHQPPWSTD